MKSNKLLKEYSIDIKDCGSSYDVTLENKKTKDVFHIPIMGDVLYFGDIVGFTNGKSPQDLTKQDWINLYLDEKPRTTKKIPK